ncbi:MAG: hypothetical protein ACE5H9_03555 [Anaerolineae bacterium]
MKNVRDFGLLFWLILLPAFLGGCARATATPPPPPPPVQAAATLPPPGPTTIAVPPVETATPGPTPSPTSPPPPTVTPTSAPLRTYRVAFVPVGETLQVRDEPADTAGVVGSIPPNVSGVQSTMDSEVDWLQITWSDLSGWARRHSLTEEVGATAFCADPATRQLVDAVRDAVQRRDGSALAQWVHPRRGLLVRVNWWNNEVRFEQGGVPAIFVSDASYDWGFEDGSGLPIQGSFKDVVLPLLDRDLAGTPQIHCNELVTGGSAGIIQLPFEYAPVNYYAIYRPPPQDNEFDWGTWAVGVEFWAGKPYLAFLVHYQWEI